MLEGGTCVGAVSDLKLCIRKRSFGFKCCAGFIRATTLTIGTLWRQISVKITLPSVYLEGIVVLVLYWVLLC